MHKLDLAPASSGQTTAGRQQRHNGERTLGIP